VGKNLKITKFQNYAACSIIIFDPVSKEH